MTTSYSAGSEPRRARKLPREEDGPQSVVERQGTVMRYLVQRRKRRQQKFLQRAEAFSLKKELARNAFLAGCIVFDGVVLPESILLLPSPYGWIVTAVAIALAVWGEHRFYRAHFVPRGPEEPAA